jgi:polyketide cyclase/dehydrase/lipid transport protein
VPSTYAFLTRWRLRATAQEVYDVLADPMGLKRWWPSVYLDVKELEPADPKTGRGRVIGLWTKGWLPYTLRWNFTVVESTPPSGFKLVAHGDFEGAGIWALRQEGDFVDVSYDWRISAEKALLRYGSLVFRPIFAANHRWAMARGLESLELELRRRRGETRVPAPPGPTFARR